MFFFLFDKQQKLFTFSKENVDEITAEIDISK